MQLERLVLQFDKLIGLDSYVVMCNLPAVRVTFS